MRLNSKIIGIILFVILFGGIGIAKTMGVWVTESTKVPAKYVSGEFAGENNPEDIRGSYSFGDITNAFGIPAAELAKAFSIKTENPASFLVKDLVTAYGGEEETDNSVDTSSMRYFVALYKGLPYELTEEIYFPLSAVEMLKDRGNLTQEQTAYLESHALDVSGTAAVSQKATGSGEESSDESEDKTIKGKTTFKEVLDWGVPKEVIEAEIGGKIPSTGMTIRDYCLQKGMEFSSVKTKLQAEVVN